MKTHFITYPITRKLFQSVSGYLLILCLGVLSTGCEKTTLTEDEMSLVTNQVRSHVMARAFDDKYVDLWNNHLSEQIDKASEQHLKTLARKERSKRSIWFSDMYDAIDDLARATGSHNTLEYKAEWVSHVADVYKERYKAVRNQMIEEIKKGFQKVDRRLDVMYDVFHTSMDEADDDLRKRVEEQDIPRTLPYQEWYGIDKTNDYVQNVRWIDKMLQNMQEIDITSVALGDYESVDAMTGHYEYFLHCVVCSCFYQVNNIKVEYIVKEPETINSFQIGFSNHTAMLCSFTENRKLVEVTFQPIEYEQTYIGMGMEK